MDVLSPRDALAVLGGDREAVGPLAERPLLAVEVSGSPAVGELARLGPELPCVLVGVSGSVPRRADDLEGFDVLLAGEPDPPRPWVGVEDPGAAAGDIADTAARSPASAVAVAQLLRLGRTLSLHDALVAESLTYGLLQSGSVFRGWLRERGVPAGGAGAPGERADAPVLVEREGSTVLVTLNRPEVHNAFDVSIRDALVEAARAVVADDSVAEVHLRGAGASFCSGGDLAEFGTTPDPATGHAVRTTRSPAAWLARIADRLTAHVHGHCIGAGIELAALARRVVAAPDTSILLPEVPMGLVPGAGGTATLPRRIGRQRTAYLALLASPVDAGTARSWGLVDEVPA